MSGIERNDAVKAEKTAKEIMAEAKLTISQKKIQHSEKIAVEKKALRRRAESAEPLTVWVYVYKTCVAYSVNGGFMEQVGLNGSQKEVLRFKDECEAVKWFNAFRNMLISEGFEFSHPIVPEEGKPRYVYVLI